jgi:dTDP-glucose 4,6-dehydratase
MNLLVTGAAGFIGSHFARLVRERRPDARLVILDALTYAGHLSTIEDLLQSGVPFVHGRIQDRSLVEATVNEHGITHVVNFAAETHNDRSILESGAFIESNVLGVQALLEVCRRAGVTRMVQVSTDEVYGSIEEGHFTEASPLEPNTPYSASKAGGDLFVRAYVKSFGIEALVTRGGNTYGPYQYPEKLIPFFVTRLIDGKKVPLYGEGTQVREWMHARDHAAGVLAVLERGEPGQAYNIGDVNSRENREVVRVLLEETGRDESFVKKIPDPRGGAHDARYSMRCDRLAGLGWKPEVDFERGLRETVRWYIDHESWWRPIVAEPDFQAFVTAFYGPSLGPDL